MVLLSVSGPVWSLPRRRRVVDRPRRHVVHIHYVGQRPDLGLTRHQEADAVGQHAIDQRHRSQRTVDHRHSRQVRSARVLHREGVGDRVTHTHVARAVQVGRQRVRLDDVQRRTRHRDGVAVGIRPRLVAVDRRRVVDRPCRHVVHIHYVGQGPDLRLTRHQEADSVVQHAIDQCHRPQPTVDHRHSRQVRSEPCSPPRRCR